MLKDTAGPIAASALTFGTTHLILRRGPCHRRLERVYASRKAAGHIPATANTVSLASQATARILNELYNFIVVPLAVAALFQAPLNRDRIYACTALARSLTTLSAGYFLAEGVIICSNFKEHGIEPFAHAAVCVAFFVTVAVQRKLHWFVPRLLFFECSTPLVHARWLLASMGLSNTALYKANGVAMICAFFTCRVFWGTSTNLANSLYVSAIQLKILFLLHSLSDTRFVHVELVWSFVCGSEKFTSPVGSPLGLITMRIMMSLAVGISGLNYYWFYKMIRGALKVFGRKRAPQSVSSKSQKPEQNS